jgi:biopolymer transport protein ExbD
MTPSGTRSVDRLFARCLNALAEALSRDASIKERGEILLRADRRIDYGLVLATMARVRRSGITHFGLVAETDADLGPPAAP